MWLLICDLLFYWVMSQLLRVQLRGQSAQRFKSVFAGFLRVLRHHRIFCFMRQRTVVVTFVNLLPVIHVEFF